MACHEPILRISRTVVFVLLSCMLVCGQTSQEPVGPAFHIHADLVTVPFQVQRGSHPIVDLKPEDLVLLEDGAPRAFTMFEAPPVHFTLDIAVMFDVTNPGTGQETRRVGFWDTKALGEMAGYWNESVTRRLLDERAVTIRFSIYRFDQSTLQRLCQFTSDPRVLSDALHRLTGPSRVGNAGRDDASIPLPAGLTPRATELKWKADGGPAQPSSLAGALSALRDSFTAPLAADKAMAARALVILSTGAEATSILPEDLATEAVDAGIPVYPVALWVFLMPPYDGYERSLFGFDGDGRSGPRKSMWGPGGPYSSIFGPAGSSPRPEAPPFAPYINYPFELLGDLTGGLHFEAVNHSQPTKPNESGPPFLFDATTPLAFSMSGRETYEVLDRTKRHALARFSSSYTVGFVPPPSSTPREHTLEVKLAPKSSGKVTEGKRAATY